jgi:hypothetical protein
VEKDVHRQASITKKLWPFLELYWRGSVVGFLLGAVLGFTAATVKQFVTQISENALKIIHSYLFPVVVWPKDGYATLLAIVFVASFLYGVRLYTFLLRILRSWRSGLVTGIEVMWFVSAGAAFTRLSFTGRYRSLLLLGVGVLGTVLIWYRDSLVERKAAVALEADPDKPIEEAGEDILNRGTVVGSIVRAIVSDLVPVLALTGAYGDGKTSVLNLLRKELERREDVVFVRFSTWLPMDEKTLVSTLLSSVGEKLNRRLFVPRIKKNFVEVTRMFFAVLPGVPASIKELLEKPSQDEQIADLRRNLARLPVRVVVLLDDMDRMHRRELDVLFKLLRGVPEFPQFSYVCAFHLPALVQTLRTSSSEEARLEAQRYLEKFFPDAIPLPQIEDALLAVQFETRFYAICDRNQLLKEPDEKQRFIDDFRTLWQTSLRGYFTNLRRLKLYTNRLNRSLPLVADEVNLRDFSLLELVRMMHPVMYEEIYRNARYFMFAPWRFTTWLQIVSPDEKEAQEKRNEYFKKLFQDLPAPPEGILLAVLKELFPTVDAYLSGRDVPMSVAQNADEAERQRRIYHPDFFPRYFLLQVPQDLFGEKETSAFVTTMNEQPDVIRSVAVFRSQYAKLQDLPMKRWDFVRRVRSAIERFKPTALEALPIAVAGLSDRFESDPLVPVEETTARAIVFAAANHMNDTLSAQTVLERVLREAASDRFATEVLNDCTTKKNRELQDWSKVDAEKLQGAFRERMKAKYISGGFTFFPNEGQADFVPLGRWGLCGTEGREQVQQYLRREFETKHSNVGKFLVRFFPAEKVHPTEDPRAQNPVGTIRTIYFSPEELADLLKTYGDLAHSSPDEARAIQEFKLEFTAART